MGTGIAIVAANSGKLNTKIVCESDVAIGSCKKFVETWIDKEVKKGKTDDKGKSDFLGRISYVPNLDGAKDSDFVVEAVYESFDLKRYNLCYKEIFSKN